ncbi:MAG TPA: ABC transporter permease [Sorangium sp.]|nr:ABC transporter permease [Sorangium sp.]
MTNTKHHMLRLALAAAGGLLLFNVLAFAFGQAPLAMLHAAWQGTWGTAYGAGQVMFKATPLLLTGLAFHVALRAGMFNIGTEGQLALGSLAGAWVAARLPANTTTLVAVASALTAALLTGAGYAAIAGVMRARLGVHEIISTIMLNRCAEVLLPWLLVVVLGATELRSNNIVAGARLLPLSTWFYSLRGSAASCAFPLAIIVTVGVYAWLKHSRAGREMRWLGMNTQVCEAQGIDVPRRRLQAMLLSGALAGAAITGTVLGYKGYFELGLGAGAGFSGIAVAMVGRRSAWSMVLSALAFGTLAQAGLATNAQLPKEAMGILEAVVILFMAAATQRHRHRVAAAPPDNGSRNKERQQAAQHEQPAHAGDDVNDAHADNKATLAARPGGKEPAGA